jgi:hypothetical protein
MVGVGTCVDVAVFCTVEVAEGTTVDSPAGEQAAMAVNNTASNIRNTSLRFGLITISLISLFIMWILLE